MEKSWTIEQVMQLAPDDASAKAGKGLASQSKWVSMGRNERALWGECSGSGSKPYQTQIDLSEPAFRCTCPSRKFPCKHGLGLLLMFASQPDVLPDSEPPAWVSEWLQKREDKADTKAKQAEAKQNDPDAQRKSEAAQLKRAQARQTRVAAGLGALELWLKDLMREGLASAQARPPKFWEEQAARLIDAQAPGAARRVREMASIVASGVDWQERLLSKAGQLALMIEGFGRIDVLPEAMQADLRTALGWTLKQEELPSEGEISDRWSVMGQRASEEDSLRVQRTWLRGENTRRDALILNFAAANQPLDTSFALFTRFEARLTFFPSAFPLRAAVKERAPVEMFTGVEGGFQSLEAMLDAYASALCFNPWLDRFPALLESVIPFRQNERWHLSDDSGDCVTLDAGYERSWQMLAISGGKPLQVYGEWDGERFLPLSVLTKKEALS